MNVSTSLGKNNFLDLFALEGLTALLLALLHAPSSLANGVGLFWRLIFSMVTF